MQVIAFDLDDTLYDRILPLKKSFINTNKLKSVPFSLFYKYYEINSDIAFGYEQEGKMKLHESRLFRISRTFEDLGISVEKSEVEFFLKCYQINQNHITLFPRIPLILDYLTRRQKQLIIITNGPTYHQLNKIKNLRLDRWFTKKQIIISGDVGIAKPDTRIFKLAEKRFSFDSKDAWFIGDSYKKDIVGSSKANWNAVWFNHRKHKNKLPCLAKKIVYSDIELKKFILDKF